MEVDYLVVGSGITGATIARVLADAGYETMVVERRSHIGGNVYDYTHPTGIRIHAYGPHYFRTNSDKIWNFLNHFSAFYKYEAKAKSYIDGHYENWPITTNYIQRVAGENWKPAFKGIPRNFEEACLSKMPRIVYEKFIKNYTEKQWGVPANILSTELAQRVNVHENDSRLTPDYEYQGIPKEGYAKIMCNILAGIPIILNFDYLKNRQTIKYKKLLIFTGPIDEFFDFRLGHLKYIAQKREHTYLPNVDYLFPCGQINNPSPNNGPYIRTLEWKHMMPDFYSNRIKGTVLTTEVPINATNPNFYEYPFLDDDNAKLYRNYRELVNRTRRVLICGRLGEYQYYDMDRAIERAITLANNILERALK